MRYMNMFMSEVTRYMWRLFVTEYRLLVLNAILDLYSTLNDLADTFVVITIILMNKLNITSSL